MKNQSLPTVENGSWCKNCNQPYRKDCEICNGTGSAIVEVMKDMPTEQEITALSCKYGCNSLRNCKGRCGKNN